MNKSYSEATFGGKWRPAIVCACILSVVCAYPQTSDPKRAESSKDKLAFENEVMKQQMGALRDANQAAKDAAAEAARAADVAREQVKWIVGFAGTVLFALAGGSIFTYNKLQQQERDAIAKDLSERSEQALNLAASDIEARLEARYAAAAETLAVQLEAISRALANHHDIASEKTKGVHKLFHNLHSADWRWKAGEHTFARIVVFRSKHALLDVDLEKKLIAAEETETWNEDEASLCDRLIAWIGDKDLVGRLEVIRSYIRNPERLAAAEKADEDELAELTK